MIDQDDTFYYGAYVIVCFLLFVAYIRIRSSEGTIITTKELQTFQRNYIIGYAMIILAELIASASFYHSFISMHLNIQQITRLYITTIISSTVTNIVIEVIDIGARKDKCFLAALLYSISMFSVLFGGHYEMLLMGRIVYGAASALHHTSFDNYCYYQHSNNGYPEDWLQNTFSLLTHAMALVAALSGLIGQISSSFGDLGCIVISCIMFIICALAILFLYEKDVNTPRFMLSSFVGHMHQTVQAMRSNKQVFALTTIITLVESSINILLLFYWAPWITNIVAGEEDSRGSHLPYEIIFSTCICASMLGNYCFSLMTSGTSAADNCFQLNLKTDTIFQSILLLSSVMLFLASMLETVYIAFVVLLVVQYNIGFYYNIIGYYRARVIVPELRTAALVIPKILTMVLSCFVLHSIHHSPMLILSCCATFNGAAAYIQFNYLDQKSMIATVALDDEDDEEL